jgi:hypothetical protein
MNKTFFVAVCAFLFAASASAQSKSLETASRQLRSLNADKQITLSHDAASGSGRMMYVAENFSDAEASRAGIQAMNFAAGFFFAGDELKAAPDPVKLTFWVKSKKPRFATSHGLTIYADGAAVVLGDSRYAAKADRNMEYLNFELSREVLKSIAERSAVKIRLGEHEFTLTPAQLKGLAAFLLVSDPAWAG